MPIKYLFFAFLKNQTTIQAPVILPRFLPLSEVSNSVSDPLWSFRTTLVTESLQRLSLHRLLRKEKNYRCWRTYKSDWTEIRQWKTPLLCWSRSEPLINHDWKIMSGYWTKHPEMRLRMLPWSASDLTYIRSIGGYMENNLQRDIDFAIHLNMLKFLLESNIITEEEHSAAVQKLREKTNCKLIVTSSNYWEISLDFKILCGILCVNKNERRKKQCDKP